MFFFGGGGGAGNCSYEERFSHSANKKSVSFEFHFTPIIFPFCSTKELPLFALLDLHVATTVACPEPHSFAAPEETHPAGYFSF